MTRARPNLQEKVAFLSDRRNYADCPRRVQTVETHFAWVFLTAGHAYKLKKPVQQADMDYRTLAAREHGCREEVRLNRRLAPTVYRSVVPLSTRGGTLVLGKGGHVVDWLIKMRRLSASGMLDRALAEGTVGEAELDRLVATLVRFFKRSEPNPISGARYIARLMRQVAANQCAFQRYGARLPQRRAAELAGAQLELIERAGAELGARGERVVEGHGDLRAEHVHLGPPVCVIDCLEFDRELRLLDPAEEIAMLALEVERLGYAPVASELARRFRLESDDLVSAVVLEFYKSNRAATRAKVAAWHLDDPQVADPRPWMIRTRSLLADALSHARAALRELEPAKLRRAGGRPALKQRNQRRSRQHARNRIAEQRGDREDGQSASP